MIIKLIGVLIIVIGFMLKLDTIAVVLVAGLATGLVAGMGFVEILEVLGGAFVSTRYMTLLLLTLALVGILERNGLRERAEMCISKLKGATCGKVLSIYVVIRTIAAILSLRIGGHVQFIRPLVYPMAKGAAEKEGKLSVELDEELKGHVNAVENYGNFYGQNGFIAGAGVLLIVGTLKELGIANIEAYSVAKSSLIMAVLSVIISIIRNYMFDMKIKRSK
ncbi:DUF969 domain-containing protein [uncultured Fusobacterium sp.]|jgi:uncharacterized membrane protein|uniref:DUF969 domain-containing protein n=1 Tax=uncultured Fusobacterium sp. TaxID=159267 RepID=UPI0025D57939|nr:DUF969 domain-containing protein [uncultured Fusobacterium sp.]